MVYLKGNTETMILTFDTLLTNLGLPSISTFWIHATQEKMFTWGEEREMLNNTSDYSDITILLIDLNHSKTTLLYFLLGLFTINVQNQHFIYVL